MEPNSIPKNKRKFRVYLGTMCGKQWGIVPEMKFLERSIKLILINWHDCVGIVRLIRFPRNNKILKLRALSIALGMLPHKRLLPISKVKSFEIWRKAFGVDPENMFSSKCKYCKVLLDRKDNDPERKLWERSNIVIGIA